MTTTPAPRGSVQSGWLSFAGFLGIMLGAFNVIEGIIALFKDDYYLTASGDLLVFDFTAWGWIWLIIGAIQILVGLGVLAGQMWARWVGILLAGLAMIGQFAFLAAYPVWAVINITLCVLVIYGLMTPPKGATG